LVAVKLPIHKIAGGRCMLNSTVPGSAGHAGKARAAHQHLDCLMANADITPEGQLGVHSAGAIGSARVGVNLSDDLGKKDVA